MPRTEVIERTIFKFEELSESAKERARSWWRESDVDMDLLDCLGDDLQNIAKIFGIEYRQRRVPLMNGGVRYEDAIYYSGFSCQGDGACFEGTYRYAKGASKAIRAYAPLDKELHGIADALAAIQRRYFYKLVASVKQRGHYYHEYCTEIEVSDGDDYGTRSLVDAEAHIGDALRRFMKWIYKTLETEYEYRNSNESVDENIMCNEYDFDEEGNRI